MSRHPIDLQKRDRRWVKEGRGQGRREHYKRWLSVRDLSGIRRNTGASHHQGTLIRPQGRVVCRDYHFASFLEASVFDIFDNLQVTPWDIEVLDILEQFPLLSTERPDEEPAADTLAIARSLGVKHIPADRPESPTVMTTDLMVKARFPGELIPRVLALAVKQESALSDPHRERVFQKLEIEMLYWQRHTFDGLPVQWYVITEAQVPSILVNNLRHLGNFLTPLDQTQLSPADIRVIQRRCLETDASSLALSRLARQLDQQLRLKVGTAIDVIYHLIAHRYLEVDLSLPLLPGRPLALVPTGAVPEEVLS